MPPDPEVERQSTSEIDNQREPQPATRQQAERDAPEQSPQRAPLEWRAGPPTPEQIGTAARPQLVRLTAHWCHWCRVLEHEVLSDPEVAAAIARDFEALVVDVDADPQWMDLPGIEGLPVLVFFDPQGRHVLTRSGFRARAELLGLLDAVIHGLRRGELLPYPERAAPVALSSFEPIDHERARAELDRLERGIFVLVNSNDGGFATPARHPHPALLFELQRWRSRTPRAETWIELTIASALRGSSPRLEGQPLADFPHDAAELIELSRDATALGDRWRDAADALPSQDPYRGLQDPIDHGVYRYAAGPGWYHPHFERRAMDNLAWALLLDARGETEAARQIQSFVSATFGSGELTPLRTSQRSDPFYARLDARERQGVAVPEVGELLSLEVQARAAQLDPARCELLETVSVDHWPRAHWQGTRADEASPDATLDAVGELLIALAACPGQRKRARTLAELVLARWNAAGFVVDARLNRLAVGICHAAPKACPQALASVEGLDIDLRFPPPLAELAQLCTGG